MCSAPSGGTAYAPTNFEVTDQRQMIGKGDGRNLEVLNRDTVSIQNEIEFLARRAAGIGGQTLYVRTLQSGRLHKQINLVLTPKSIEIAGDDDRFGGRPDQLMQISKLKMAMTIFKRQMDQKDRQLIQFEFDDQAFDAGIEIMEALTLDPWGREKSVSLLAHDRKTAVEALLTVLALIGGVMPHGVCHGLGLVDAAGADRTGINLYEADDIRVVAVDEAGDSLQVVP